jgi:hypothetical protein
MTTCSDYSEMLLDYLYGLLDEELAQCLRQHLADCATCQAALADAKRQQNLFAHAALPYREVQTFQKPAEEMVPVPNLAILPASQRPRSEPPMPPARTHWRWRRWTAVGAAAAVLATVIVGYAQYQTGLHQRQHVADKARKEVNKIDARFANFNSEFKAKEAHLSKEVQGQFLHLHVVGPATYHPGAANIYRITTFTPEGKPTVVPITVRLLDEANQDLFPPLERVTTANGDLRVVLPRLSIPSGTTPVLVIEARKSLARVEVKEEVRQKLPVEEVTFLTHLSINKSVLRAGDILFFRTVSLERYSLVPVDKGVPMAFTLYRRLPPHRRIPDQLEVVKQLVGSTEEGGIALGEFAITENVPEGDYVLVGEEIVEAGERGAGIKPVVRNLRVNRDDAPPVAQILLDQRQYEPGQSITGKFRGQSKAANQTVVITTTAGPKPLNYFQLSTDAFGNAPFSIPTPDTMAAGPVQMEFEVHNGVKNEKFKEKVDVVKLRPVAEFFPEGGDLVADVPNRVYFRLNVPLWARPELRCALVDSKHQVVANVDIGHSGMGGQTALGQFTFTPRFGEVYQFRVIANRREVVFLPMPGNAMPNLPQIKQNSLALSTPTSVLTATDPLRVHLWTTKKNAELLVVASCRGRIVDQKELVAAEKFTEVVLEPAPGASGVLRITVFEKPQSENEWRPLAERLVYRLPGEYLKLSAMPHKGTRKAYGLGEKIELHLEAWNESQAPMAAWLNVLVIDSKAQSPADVAQPGVGAFFLMTTELRQPEDLENADFLLADVPGAAEALELYLGTQGWRTFRDSATSGPTKMTIQNAGNTELVPALFAGGTRLANVHERFRRKLDQERLDRRKDAERTVEDLDRERDHAVSAWNRAEDELNDYRQMPLRYVRPAMGVLIWLLMAVGVAWLLAALVVVLRRQRSPRFYLVSAFCTLLLTVVVYGVTGRLRTDLGDAGPDSVTEVKPPILSLDDSRLAAAKPDRDDTGKVLVQVFGARTEKPADLMTKARPEGEKLGALRDLDKQDINRQAIVAALDQQEAAAQKKAQGSAAVQDRIGYLLNLEKMNDLPQGGYGGAGPGSPSVNYNYANKDKKPDGGKSKSSSPDKAPAPVEKRAEAKAGGETAVLREYAHINTVGVQDYQDTVLWYPALVTENGTAKVSFELSGKETTYRIVVNGHTANGRLGVFHGKLQAK